MDKQPCCSQGSIYGKRRSSNGSLQFHFARAWNSKQDKIYDTSQNVLG